MITVVKNGSSDEGFEADTIYESDSVVITGTRIERTIIQKEYTQDITIKVVNSNLVEIARTKIKSSSLADKLGYDSIVVTSYFDRYAGAIPPAEWLGDDTQTTSEVTDTAPPVISAVSPPSGVTVLLSPVHIEASVKDQSTIAAVCANGKQMQGYAGRYSIDLGVTDGKNVIVISARDIYGNSSSDTLELVYQKPEEADTSSSSDSMAPVIVSTFPESGDTLRRSPVTLSVFATDDKGIASVTVNNVLCVEDTVSATYTVPIGLMPGGNKIVITAYDKTGKSTTETIVLFMPQQSSSDTTVDDSSSGADTTPPVIQKTSPAAGDTVATSGALMHVTATDKGGSGMEMVFLSNLTIGMRDAPMRRIGEYEFQMGLKMAPGKNTIVLRAIDRARNQAVDTMTIYFSYSATDTTADTTTSPSDSGQIIPGSTDPIDNGIFVVSPEPGRNIPSGQTFPIHWEMRTQVKQVVISVSTDDGKTWQSLFNQTFDAGMGKKGWPVSSQFISHTCRIKVADFVKPNVYGISGRFSVVDGGSSDTTTDTTSDTTSQEDIYPPVIEKISPPDGATVTHSGIMVHATVRDKGPSGISRVYIGNHTTGKLNIVMNRIGEYDFEMRMGLIAGQNTLSLRAIDNAGNQSADTVTITYEKGADSTTTDTTDTTTSQSDTLPPEILTISPSPGETLYSSKVTLKVKVSDEGGSGVSTVLVDNKPMNRTSEYDFEMGISLVPGENVFGLRASDRAGNQSLDTAIVLYYDDSGDTTSGDTTSQSDTIPPTIKGTSPASGDTVSDPSSILTVSAYDEGGSGINYVYMNGKPMNRVSTEQFQQRLSLYDNENSIAIRVVDKAGNAVTDTLIIYLAGGTDSTGGTDTTVTGDSTSNDTLSMRDIPGSTPGELALARQMEPREYSFYPCRNLFHSVHDIDFYHRNVYIQVS
jgi:hypothetical protein